MRKEVMKKSNQLLKFSWKMKKTYENMLRPVGEELLLTQNEMDVLLFLYNNEPMDTAKEISQYRAMSKSMISKSVEMLMIKGYIKGQEDQKDKRVIHLSLLPKSQPIIQKLHQVQVEFYDLLEEGISEEEIETIIKVLDKMENNLSKKLR